MTWWQTTIVQIGTVLVNAVIAGEHSKGRAVILSGRRLIIQDERGKVVAGAKKVKPENP